MVKKQTKQTIKTKIKQTKKKPNFTELKSSINESIQSDGETVKTTDNQ